MTNVIGFRQIYEIVFIEIFTKNDAAQLLFPLQIVPMVRKLFLSISAPLHLHYLPDSEGPETQIYLKMNIFQDKSQLNDRIISYIPTNLVLLYNHYICRHWNFLHVPITLRVLTFLIGNINFNFILLSRIFFGVLKYIKTLCCIVGHYNGCIKFESKDRYINIIEQCFWQKLIQFTVLIVKLQKHMNSTIFQDYNRTSGLFEGKLIENLVLNYLTLDINTNNFMNFQRQNDLVTYKNVVLNFQVFLSAQHFLSILQKKKKILKKVENFLSYSNIENIWLTMIIKNLNFGVFRPLKHKPPFSPTTGNYILG
ncbi:hypothetical protein AGLY_012466 [Aphis glycines]|uniref:Uncharacterized protein n=1 Tax=Aphis glycines TaxID=307491 RepID=A0A6G0TBH0_APHGL|nr:hypothetical protein AGLY_012466 [Aphis glycines]